MNASVSALPFAAAAIVASVFALNPHTMNAAIRALPFDAAKSFTPIARLAEGALALEAHPSFPAQSVPALLEMAHKKPNGTTYAVSGSGGINHFAGALFSRMANIRLLDAEVDKWRRIAREANIKAQ